MPSTRGMPFFMDPIEAMEALDLPLGTVTPEQRKLRGGDWGKGGRLPVTHNISELTNVHTYPASSGRKRSSRHGTMESIRG